MTTQNSTVPAPPPSPEPSPPESDYKGPGGPGSTLPNPYHNILGKSNRIQTEVSERDYMLIKLIRPGQGTIRAVIGILWSKLCEYLRNNDILDNSKQNEFEHFLRNSRLISNAAFEQLTNDAAKWHACNGFSSTGSSPGPDSSNRGALSETNRGDVGKRATRIRKVRSNEQS